VTVWEQERALARTTVGWGLGSMAAGLVLGAARRRSAWWRAFGLQHAGWGAVDLLIALLAGRLQDRRMRRHPDPYAAAALEAERAKLFRVLWINVLADAGYVGLGTALTRHRRPRAAGAGAAMAIQGAFLLLHDAHYAWRTRPGRDGPGLPSRSRRVENGCPFDLEEAP
jgi:hypothetical protein